VIKYRYEGEIIPETELIKIIKDWKTTDQQRAIDLEMYYKGKNTKILKRQLVKDETDAPDNKVPVPYGRKLVKTVQGYMYKPGLIQYEFDGDDTQIRQIFKDNWEPSKTSNIRAYSVADGYSYELHYTESNGESVSPRFTLVKASQGFMIWDYSIEPKKQAFVYEYQINEDLYYDVYYDKLIVKYSYDDKKKQLKEVEVGQHFYKDVPVIYNANNDEEISDIGLVKSLIDAYDVLMSDSLNEFDRFAWAYLKLVGVMPSDEDIKDMKQKRVFGNLDDPDAISFLTKDIPTDYIEMMRKWVRNEIHSQSFIPDLEEIKTSSSASGVSIDRFIYVLEYTATDKESMTRIALQERLSLMRNLPNLTIPEAKIIMLRNTPANDKEKAELFNIYWGKLSEKTVITHFAPQVEDVDEELKLIKKMKEEHRANMPDLDNIPDEEAEDEIEE
jgi:SPP1 family phage portal protein